MPSHEVSTESNSYYCVYKAVPDTQNYRVGNSRQDEWPPVKYIMGHKPHITTDKVHHIVVYACDSEVSYQFDVDDSRQEGVAFECSDMPRGCEKLLPHAW